MLRLLLPETGPLLRLMGLARHRLQEARAVRDNGAMSAEAMIIIGILVATAVTALGIIAAKVIAKANSLNLG